MQPGSRDPELFGGSRSLLKKLQGAQADKNFSHKLLKRLPRAGLFYRDLEPEPVKEIYKNGSQEPGAES